MMPNNRLTPLFSQKKKILSVYLTAGYPHLGSTLPICQALAHAGVDLLEVGFPFSDPLADGPIIQQSSEIALRQGMSLQTLFSQLENIRQSVQLPLLLMGYLNPVLQFGVARFAAHCRACGIDGVILPDLPREEYLRNYRDIFESENLHVVWLVTPNTSAKRIREIDDISTTFIYAVSSAAVTGGILEIDHAREAYFERLQQMHLRSPILVGFGISDRRSFEAASHYTNGAIIGSAFIKALAQGGEVEKTVRDFVTGIRN